jgi:hypothetical protein
VTGIYLLLQKVTMPTSNTSITSFWVPIEDTKGALSVFNVSNKDKKKAKVSASNAN